MPSLLQNLIGPIIGAAGSLLGGREQRRAVEDQSAANTALQREFAQHGVRWRVEDAEQAGVHPLFALGGSGASFSPNAIAVGDSGVGGALREMGQGVSRAVAAQETVQQRELHNAQLRLMTAQADRQDAEAALARSEIMRRSGAQAGPGMPEGVVKVNPVNPFGQFEGLVSHPLFADAVKLDADPMVSRSSIYPGQTAGVGHSSMREFEMPNGDRILLPATQGGGIPEEIDMTLIPEIIGANIRRYGFSQTVLGALHRWLGKSYREGMYTPGHREWERRFGYRGRQSPKDSMYGIPQ